MEAPLLDAARRGDTAKVRRLLAEGAGIDQIDKYGKSALMLVSIYNHLETASVLLEEHGADVNQANRWGFTPMSAACIGGNLDMVQLLSSYGAARTFTNRDRTKCTAEELAKSTIIPATRAHALLRKGASILAATAPGDPTPLSLARELQAKGEAAEGSAAALVLSWWRPRLLALAMGTHTRLGAESPFRHLVGHHAVIEMIAEKGS
jgi:ankyrin repeat protein